MLEFDPTNVRLGVIATSKDEAIRQVAAILADNGFIEPAYAESMLAREGVSNTYLGKGIAIPHGLPKDRGLIHKTGIAVVQVPAGVEWIPGEIARLVVGIAARSDEHLQLLANLTDVLYDDATATALAYTDDAADIVAALAATPRPQAAAAGDFALAVDVVVGGAHGLHARPATRIAHASRGFDAEVRIRNGDKVADGRSLAAILKLGARHGETVRVSAEGPQAAAALAALRARIEAADDDAHEAPAARHDGWTPSAVEVTVPGVAASPGLAIGPIRLIQRQKIVVERTARDPERERQRLAESIATAGAQLRELHEQVRRKSGEGAAAIFLAHAEFLVDPDLASRTERRIGAGQSAGWAWQQTIQEEVEALRKVDDPLLAGRAIDLADVGTRVLRTLGGAVEDAFSLPDEPSILLADDLTPSDAAGLDPARVLGFCTAAGGPTSHAAIIARSLDIPAVVGTGPAVLHQPDGALAILDGSRGALYVGPSEADVAAAREVLQSMAAQRDVEANARWEPAITTDGTRMEVVANIGRPAEAAQAVEAGGEGVGLLRSEFLFLERDAAPTEDEQYEAYREMVEALNGLPLIIRTLDIGGDKHVPYLDLPPEANPFLGVRGIRLCLAYPALFRTQLRAIYRASKHGVVKIMFPMIATVEELRAGRAMAEEVRAEVGADPVDIGIMVEVPSAVVMAAELAREADFFSIGTNDLTQYVLAMDRGHPTLARQADGLHPAVLRMIDQTVRAATEAGRWVGVCGGMAGDPLGAVILMGLGVTELSVSIPSIAAIKARIRATSMTRARELARRALAASNADEVRAL